MKKDLNGLDVAIVGGGITGVTLALGLLTRNIHARVYERASSFREIGAGIGFSPNAEWAMKVVDPRIHAAFKKVATPNASDWFQYVDGQHDGDDIRLLFQVYLGERGFEGCARSEFLDELAKLLPDGAVEYKKNLDSVQVADQPDSEKLVLKFGDGTTATADVGMDIYPSSYHDVLTIDPTN